VINGPHDTMQYPQVLGLIEQGICFWTTQPSVIRVEASYSIWKCAMMLSQP
jgi:hypothetical protein